MMGFLGQFGLRGRTGDSGPHPRDHAARDHWEHVPFSPLFDDRDDDPDFPDVEQGHAHDRGHGLWRRLLPARTSTASAERTRRWWIVRGLLAPGLALVLLVAWLAVTAPLGKSLRPVVPPQITLLAADGTPIARKGAIVEAPVIVSDLPPHVVGAFLAIEDRRFYSHWGIDPRGIARATWSNLVSGRRQGGSTITQQLAKFTFLTPEQSLTRKGREALIALWLEAWLSKDEILGRYLSNAYFGANAYGLRAASLHYFHRQPERLTPAQAAMLAGLLQAPSRYAPTSNYALAEARMRTVLGAMVEVGYLDAEEAAAMPAPALDVRAADDLPAGTYFADWALPQARQLTEVSYARQALTTTLDSRLQTAARRAVGRAALGDAQVALVAMRANGEVVAMIGGRDYAASPFNRATQARRQPGSTFKLFVWLAALEAGWRPDDTIDNTPIATGSYRPRNADGRYSDEITLRDALASSSNVAAVRLLGQVGHDRVIGMARDLGVTAPLPEGDPSLALGTSTMTLTELTAVYAGVAGNSFPVTPRAFAADKPGWFDWLWSRRDSLSQREHEAIGQMLRHAVNHGTGRAAMLAGPNHGKTGTTQDNRDALFVGYSGDLVVGVWIGNDDNSPLEGISGGGLPARIWRDFMREALGEPARTAPAPRADPDGPVEPQDAPGALIEAGLPTIPLEPVAPGDILIGEIAPEADGARVRMEQGGAAASTGIEATPSDLRPDGANAGPETGATAEVR